MNKEISPLGAFTLMTTGLVSEEEWKEYYKIVVKALKRIPELVRESNKLYDENRTNQKQLEVFNEFITPVVAFLGNGTEKYYLQVRVPKLKDEKFEKVFTLKELTKEEFNIFRGSK